MSAAMKSVAQARWDACERVATVLGCGKTHVHDKLYKKLKEEELLELVMEGEPTAVATVKAWPELSEETKRSWVPCSDDDVAKNPLEKVKIAIWFAKKMGGISLARKALDMAAMLDEELRG